MEVTFFSDDLQAVGHTLKIIEQWNAMSFVNKPIQVNVPEVKTFNANSVVGSKKVLVEPFIDNWQKWNSNTGWSQDTTGWNEVMQALSHYSYHISSGQSMLCDLQGGITASGAVISDPVIMSAQRKFGLTDLGPKGICNFFAYHKCNKFCKAQWTKPAAERCYAAVESSTMEAPTTVQTTGLAMGFVGLAMGSVAEYSSDEDYW